MAALARRMLIAGVLLFVLAATTLAGQLKFDLRLLKTQCCQHEECVFQPVGEQHCPQGWTVFSDPELTCTDAVACEQLRSGMSLMQVGGAGSDECHAALLAAFHSMPLNTTAGVTGAGYGRKVASAVRSNLAVSVLVRGRKADASLHLAHRLLSRAILADPSNAAAVDNLLAVGGRAACADFAEHGEEGFWGRPCEAVPGYHTR
eukprot:2225311-Rhodomonas_salina.2